MEKRVHDFTFVLAWRVAAESRWNHTLHLLVRYLVGCVARKYLPRALSAVQTTTGVEFSMATMLAKLVAADREDWSSASKLRVLRLAQNLGPVSSMGWAAVYVQTSQWIDNVLFATLGEQGKKEPASIIDIVNPVTSPIVIALEKLAVMADGWAPDGVWPLLEAVSVDPWDDADLRLNARKQLYQLSTGLMGRCIGNLTKHGVDWLEGQSF